MNDSELIEGRIFTSETLGAVDGPGLRYVLFMQGCVLRCKYCHNPESWSLTGGSGVTVKEAMEDILKYRNFFNASGGGVTVSGGEPLLQSEFVTELFKRCREEGIHTALDTSGYHRGEIPEELVENTDLVLLDIKCMDADVYRELTGVGIEPTLDFAEYLNKKHKRTWIRYVIVPGINSSDIMIHALAQYASSMDNVEFVELLPFHKMGERKWDEAGLCYELRQIELPDGELIDHARGIFVSHGLKVK